MSSCATGSMARRPTHWPRFLPDPGGCTGFVIMLPKAEFPVDAMRKISVRPVLLALSALLAVPSAPSAAEQSQPAPESLAAVFGARPGAQSPELSPDGKNLVYIAPGAG